MTIVVRAARLAAIGAASGVAVVAVAAAALVAHEHWALQRAAHGRARALHRITQ